MNIHRIGACAAAAAVLSMSAGCASTYGNLASANGLGAAEYRPAVLVPPDKRDIYEQILQQCRHASFNRQVTAAQKGQEGTLTGAVEGAAGGAAAGFQISSIFKDAGLGGSKTSGFLSGAGIGALTSLAGSFASGTSDTSDAVRLTLLTCLRSQAPKYGYTVLE
jgi:hypothetical protein